jgi:hypothetical protein
MAARKRRELGSEPSAPPTEASTAMTGGDARTRERAYAIWEREGRPHGRALDHWLQAEAELAAAATSRRRRRRTVDAASPDAATPSDAPGAVPARRPKKPT